MERKIREQKGITLVALVITIIVMLILVAVSVTVAINGGLFTKAKEAGNAWETKSAEEAAGNIVNVDNQIMNIDSAINTLQERPTTETPVDPEEPQTPAKTIIFYLGGVSVTFTTTEGTTWAEWIRNDCPVDYFSISDDGKVVTRDASNEEVTYAVLNSDYEQVYGSDPIEDGQIYMEEV